MISACHEAIEEWVHSPDWDLGEWNKIPISVVKKIFKAGWSLATLAAISECQKAWDEAREKCQDPQLEDQQERWVGVQNGAEICEENIYALLPD